jgi:hypothetical protein
MSEPTAPKEYRFKTFQELVDRVPSDKIELCMSEMGQAFAQAKGIVELGYGLLGVKQPESIVKLPDEFGWIDDGKCIVTTHLAVQGQEPFIRVTTETKK